jgi:hypothetical protein
MFLVQLQYNPRSRYAYTKPWNKVICGCEKEEDAHEAGRKAAAVYNGLPIFFGGEMSGCIELSMNYIPDNYSYAVKYHEGEWNPTKGEE